MTAGGVVQGDAGRWPYPGMRPERDQQRVPNSDFIFDLEPGADSSEINAAWKRAAIRWHPDRPQGDAKRFIEAQKAYQLLKQWSARPKTNPHRTRHQFHRDRDRDSHSHSHSYPSEPIWIQFLTGVVQLLSIVTLFLPGPIAVIGAVSFLLGLALRPEMDPDPGWVVAVVGSWVWIIGYVLICILITNFESWFQPKSRQPVNPRKPHRSRTAEHAIVCGLLAATALLWLTLFILCCRSGGLLLALINPLLLAGAAGWLCVLLTHLKPEHAARLRNGTTNLLVMGFFAQLSAAGTHTRLAEAGGSDFWPGLVTLAPVALQGAYLGAFCLSFWWYASWSSPNRHRWWMILGLVHLEATVLFFFEGLPPEGPIIDFVMFLLIGFSPWVLATVDGWRRR